MSGSGLGVAGMVGMLQYPGIAFTTFRSYMAGRKATKINSAFVKKIRCSKYEFKKLTELVKQAMSLGRTNIVDVAAKRRAAGQKAKEAFVTFVANLVKYTNLYIEGKALQNVVTKASLETLLKSLVVFLVYTEDKNQLTINLERMASADARLSANNVGTLGNSQCVEEGYLYNTPLDLYPSELLTALHAALTLVHTDGNQHTKELLALIDMPAGRMVDFPTLKENKVDAARIEAAATEKELKDTLPKSLPRTTPGALNKMAAEEKLKADAEYLAEQLDFNEEDADSMGAEVDDHYPGNYYPNYPNAGAAPNAGAGPNGNAGSNALVHLSMTRKRALNEELDDEEEEEGEKRARIGGTRKKSKTKAKAKSKTKAKAKSKSKSKTKSKAKSKARR